MSTAAHVLPDVDRRLRHEFGNVPLGSTPLGNRRNPLDELVFIQLSVRTREISYQSIYLALRRLVKGSWGRIIDLPRGSLLRVLERGGMGRVKLERLRGQIEQLQTYFGRVTLAPLHNMSTDEAELLLRSLPGVGPKVARCILLYSLDRDVFPVDSNCHRVLRRLGFLPPGVHVKAAHDFLQDLVPRRIRRSLHVNLVRHGRTRCLPATPDCNGCPLLSLCPTGARRTRGDSTR